MLNVSLFCLKFSDVLKEGVECINCEKEIEYLDEVLSDEKEGGCLMRLIMFY